MLFKLLKENKILFFFTLLISLAISYLSYKTYKLDSVSLKIKLEDKADKAKKHKQPIVYIPEPTPEDPTKPRPEVRTIHRVCIAGHLFKYSFEPIFEQGQLVPCIGTPDDL